MNFNLGYRSTKGSIILEREKIISRYFRGWFCLDLCSCFPFYLFLEESLRLIKMFRLLKIVRCVRLPLYYDKLAARTHWRRSISRIVGLTLSIASFVHFSACVFYFIGDDPNQEYTWIHEVMNLITRTNNTPHPGPTR